MDFSCFALQRVALLASLNCLTLLEATLANLQSGSARALGPSEAILGYVELLWLSSSLGVLSPLCPPRLREAT